MLGHISQLGFTFGETWYISYYMTKENIPSLLTRKDRYHYANDIVNISARKKLILKTQVIDWLMQVRVHR